MILSCSFIKNKLLLSLQNVDASVTTFLKSYSLETEQNEFALKKDKIRMLFKYHLKTKYQIPL